MIEGFKLKVPGTELKRLCENRIGEYKQRVDDWSAKVAERGPNFISDIGNMSYGYDLALASHEQEQWQRRAQFIDENEMYLLTEKELQFFERCPVNSPQALQNAL